MDNRIRIILLFAYSYPAPVVQRFSLFLPVVLGGWTMSAPPLLPGGGGRARSRARARAFFPCCWGCWGSGLPLLPSRSWWWGGGLGLGPSLLLLFLGGALGPCPSVGERRNFSFLLSPTGCCLPAGGGGKVLCLSLLLPGLAKVLSLCLSVSLPFQSISGATLSVSRLSCLLSWVGDQLLTA